MAICTIISDETNAQTLIQIGLQFAKAHKLKLVICIPIIGKDEHEIITETWDTTTPRACLPGAEKLVDYCHDLLEGLNLTENKEVLITQIRSPERVSSIQQMIDKERVSLLMIDKQKVAKLNRPNPMLALELFQHATCCTMLIRLNSLEDGRCTKILVPAAGGPHAINALKWAAPLSKDNTEITPLYIQSEKSAEANLQGDYHLQMILEEAKVYPHENIKPRVELSENPSQTIGLITEEDFDFILIGASDRGALRKSLFSTIPEKILKQNVGTSIAIIRSKKPLLHRLRDRIESWLDLRVPQLEREDRIALYDRLESQSRWGFDFFALISLSTAIAALGLLQNSTAVVIGAMLVAPLMTPLLGAGLSIVQGNAKLMKRSLVSITNGFLIALFIGFFIGLCNPVAELTGELRARGGPGLSDLTIALLSGIAAAYCSARKNLSAALPGVAIAAALVPPIATAGIALSMSEYSIATGATILFSTNVVAIVLGSSLSFYGGGIRGNTAHSAPVRWVRRSISTLLICAAILIIPLASVLVGKIHQSIQEMRDGSSSLRIEIESYMTSRYDCEASVRKSQHNNGHPYYIIECDAEKAFPQNTLKLMRKEIKELSDKNIKLSLKTNLVLVD